MAIKPAGKNNEHPYTGTARVCGLGPNMHSRYYATTRISKMERVVDLLLLCAIDLWQPISRWYGYCNNCSLLHTQREGKFSVAFPE